MGYYSLNRPRRDGRLSWPCWLTDSGRLTHKVVTRPAISLAQDRESLPAVTGVLTTMLHHHLVSHRLNNPFQRKGMLQYFTELITMYIEVHYVTYSELSLYSLTTKTPKLSYNGDYPFSRQWVFCDTCWQQRGWVKIPQAYLEF